jgi:hypothetical protein
MKNKYTPTYINRTLLEALVPNAPYMKCRLAFIEDSIGYMELDKMIDDLTDFYNKNQRGYTDLDSIKNADHVMALNRCGLICDESCQLLLKGL